MKHSPTSPVCQHALLARSPIGHVSVCAECDVVQLCLDCVSVRLEAMAFMALAAMVLQAQKRLQCGQSREDCVGNPLAPVVH